MKTLINKTNTTNAFWSKTLCAAALSLALACSATSARAAGFNSSKSGIKSIATVSWSQFGGPGSLVSSPSAFGATNGMTGLIGFQGGGNGKAIGTKGISGISPIITGLGPDVTGQAISGDDWIGNFYGDETALWTNSPGQGPLTILFNQGVPGAGTQIQADFYGPFTVEMTAYDLNLNVLGSFREDGVSNNMGDGSAIFLGVTDSTADIGAISYSLVSCNGDCGDFAINELVIGPAASPTPEPGTLALLGTGIVGLSGYLRRRLRG
jgi:PEP-CTERM motif